MQGTQDIIITPGLSKKITAVLCTKGQLKKAIKDDKESDETEAKKKATAEAKKSPEAGATEDSALNRLRKYIPSEILVVWASLESVVESRVAEKDRFEVSLGLFIFACVVTVMYTVAKTSKGLKTIQDNMRKASNEPGEAEDGDDDLNIDEKRLTIVGQTVVAAIAFALYALIDGPPFSYLSSFPKYWSLVAIAAMPLFTMIFNPIFDRADVYDRLTLLQSAFCPCFGTCCGTKKDDSKINAKDEPPEVIIISPKSTSVAKTADVFSGRPSFKD